MTEQPTPIKTERITPPQEQLDYVAQKITSELPPSLSNNEFIINMWARIIPQIMSAPDQETINKKFGLLITKLDLKSSNTGKEKLLEDLAGLQDMLTDPDYANDEKAQQEIRNDINKLEQKIDRNQESFGDDFEKVRDSILEAREKFQNGTLAQEIPEPAPEPVKEELAIIEAPSDIELPTRVTHDNTSLTQAEKEDGPAESSNDTPEEVVPDVSQDTPRRRAIIPESERVKREEIFDPELFKNPPIDGVYHFLPEEESVKQEQEYDSEFVDYDAYRSEKNVDEVLARLSENPKSPANMFRNDYNADSHPEIPDARITLGDTVFTIRDSNRNEIILQSVDDEKIIHKIDRKKFEKIREAMKLQTSLEGSPKGTLAVTDEQKKLKAMLLEALFAEGAPVTKEEEVSVTNNVDSILEQLDIKTSAPRDENEPPTEKELQALKEKFDKRPKLDELDRHPRLIESEKINDRTSLAEAITTGYQQEILDLYDTYTFENVEMVREFNQSKALELVQEITVRYHLPITKITTLADNIYEMNMTLANGVVLEHVGKITSATNLREKATLVHIAQTVLNALSDDEVAEILAKIKSGAKNTSGPEIVLVPYQAVGVGGGEVAEEESVIEIVEPEEKSVQEESGGDEESTVETKASEDEDFDDFLKLWKGTPAEEVTVEEQIQQKPPEAKTPEDEDFDDFLKLWKG